MANKTRNYKSFFSYNQMIDGQFVNSVQVRIFKPLDTVPTDYSNRLLATDGQTFRKSNNVYVEHITSYSFVVLSSGISERFPGNSHYLHIKVYLTDAFDMEKLDGEDFLGKTYVVEAIKKYLDPEAETTASEPEALLPPLLNYFRKKKVGADYEDFYHHLRDLSQTFEFDKIEELFNTYKISSKYQALFWKEMYQERAIRKKWNNFKFRWEGLLENEYPIATMNVKIYQKNHEFFIHEKNLEITDGDVRNGIVDNFSYVIVSKYIRRVPNPKTYHLDIKVYLAFDFKLKKLPEISDFWGEYVHKAIEIYLASPKTSSK